MRAHLVPAGLLLALAAGCGSEESHVNDDRPASAVTVTASVVDRELTVSPTKFGAGPVRFLVSNETQQDVRLTFETAGSEAGTTARSPSIAPAGVASMQAEPQEGEYELRASDPEIPPVTITVGAPRASGQDELLQP